MEHFTRKETQYYGHEGYRDRESQGKQYNIQKNKRIELDRQNGHFNKIMERTKEND